MTVRSVKLTADLHEQLVDRKHRSSEAIEDVVLREMGLEPRTDVLTNP